MRKLLQCEFLKTRRRFLLLTVLGITAVQMGWALSGNYTPDSLRYGWMMFLYQFPLYNAIFLPILAIVISSRLCDIEHKGVMFKHLCTTTPKGKLYDAKLIYGIVLILISIFVSWTTLFLFGTIKGFEGKIPMKLYLLYLLFTIVPAVAVYIFQHTLSILFQNQAVSFFVGILGEFCGVFSLFLPQVPILRKSLLWGSFGVLQFVGMFGWNKETRMSKVYFEVMDIDWLSFGFLILVSIGMYLVGRKLFCEREVG